MHQHDICLCAHCIARVGVPEAEQAAFRTAWFEAARAAGSKRASECVSEGIRRRARSAA